MKDLTSCQEYYLFSNPLSRLTHVEQYNSYKNGSIPDITIKHPIRQSSSDIKKQIDVPPKQYDFLPFIEKREVFLNWLLKTCEYRLEWIPLTDKIAIYISKVCEGFKEGYTSNHYPEFKLYNLKKNAFEEFESGEGVFFDGLNFNPDWNTRDILLSEGVLELEKGKTFQQNIEAFWGTVISLIKFKIHFAVFYAEGMRTPHIHIYNLFPNVNDWAEKELAMCLFARKVVPFEYFHLLDLALFGEHTIALEFSKHYKTGHMNKLLFEHIPKVAQ